MRILITGSEGHIGTALKNELKRLGHSVFGIDLVQNYRSDYICDDIRTLYDSKEKLLNYRPDVIFHLAAMVSRVGCKKSPSNTIATNVLGTQNIINLAIETGAKLINFSTSEVYGNKSFKEEEDSPEPNNIYGLSKKMAEDLIFYSADKFLFRPIIVRPFMIYSEFERKGENKSVLIRFIEAALNNKKMTVHIGASRSWLHLSDAVFYFILLMNTYNDECNEKHIINGVKVYNIGDNSEKITAHELAIKICNKVGVSTDLINFCDLPKEMTLDKDTSFKNLKEIKGYTKPKILLSEGIDRVLRAF